MKTANLTHEALSTVTPEQIRALIRLLNTEHTAQMTVTKGGFDLPDGYLAFRLDYADPGNGTSIFGGIDPEGSVST